MIVYNLRPRKVWIVVHKDRQKVPAFPYSWKTQAAARFHILKNSPLHQAGDYFVVPGIESRTVRVDFKLPPRTKPADEYYRHDGKRFYDTSLAITKWDKYNQQKGK